MTYLKDVNIQAADSPSIDAFGRWRTSEQFTLFDSKMLYDKAPDFYDEVTNGTATSNWANSKVTMTVSANNDYVIRQSKVRLTYQPGKSQLVILTGLIGGAAADTVSRLGYFNSSIVAPHTADFDGLYFEQAAGVVTINQRRNGADTGTVAQASWNVDTLDGNGPSAITVDWTVPQIFFMDFEWLGLGRVRFGLVIDGIPVVCHAFNNANSLASALQPYMISPNHSVRYEIRSTGGTSSLEQVCSSVQSEGGFNPNGTDRSYDLGIGPGQQVDADTAGTLYACIGIRLKTTHLDAAIDVLKLSTLCDSGSDFQWQLALNPTRVGGTFTYAAAATNSPVEVARGATGAAPTVTRGTGILLDSGYVAQEGGSDISPLRNALRLGSTIAGVRDEIVLSISAGSTNEDVFASLTWREL